MLALDVSSLEMQFPGLAAPVLAIERFHLPAGGRLAITGASGSGKSTFVNAITGLEKVTRGSVSWSGTEITRLSSGRRDAFRARNIGLVMQDFHLFPGLSAFENVVLPVRLTRRLAPHERDRALYLLSATGIARPQQKIETLSRGEMQRVAVARALLSRPGVIVADEPTASLDRQAGKEVAELLLQLAAEEGTTLVVVTHDASLAERLGRRINLASGRMEEDIQEAGAQ
ncbi:ATP-binding cassette domain-containing protein [Rhizobium lusitanum]|uniref:ATP-binding cassette domain-containing protein n=1 Tax=Rhizobium lusitanum TaxID=293958 RepID=A0A6L9UDK2_9HYPH|nr:ATP-binding cassette domain-containing protein [Rhizobium lusitanum]NEI74055.1 ATP-binding cassette domain-containing protein [Rhizobium lusitanum]